MLSGAQVAAATGSARHACPDTSRRARAPAHRQRPNQVAGRVQHADQGHGDDVRPRRRVREHEPRRDDARARDVGAETLAGLDRGKQLDARDRRRSAVRRRRADASPAARAPRGTQVLLESIARRRGPAADHLDDARPRFARPRRVSRLHRRRDCEYMRPSCTLRSIAHPSSLRGAPASKPSGARRRRGPCCGNENQHRLPSPSRRVGRRGFFVRPLTSLSGAAAAERRTR